MVGHVRGLPIPTKNKLLVLNVQTNTAVIHRRQQMMIRCEPGQMDGGRDGARRAKNAMHRPWRSGATITKDCAKDSQLTLLMRLRAITT